MGFSRRAYAVQSLAGVIDIVGLLHADHARERNIRDVSGHYECKPGSDAAKALAVRHCHRAIDNEMTGVWDTVKALVCAAPSTIITLWAGGKAGLPSAGPAPSMQG